MKILPAFSRRLLAALPKSKAFSLILCGLLFAGVYSPASAAITGLRVANAPGGAIAAWDHSVPGVTHKVGYADYVDSNTYPGCNLATPKCNYNNGATNGNGYDHTLISLTPVVEQTGQPNQIVYQLNKSFPSGRKIAIKVGEFSGSVIIGLSWGYTGSVFVPATDPFAGGFSSGDYTATTAVLSTLYPDLSNWQIEQQPAGLGAFSLSGSTLTYTPVPGVAASAQAQISAQFAGQKFVFPFTVTQSIQKPVAPLVSAVVVPGGVLVTWPSQASPIPGVTYKLGYADFWTSLGSAACLSLTPSCEYQAPANVTDWFSYSRISANLVVAEQSGGNYYFIPVPASAVTGKRLAVRVDAYRDGVLGSSGNATTNDVYSNILASGISASDLSPTTVSFGAAFPSVSSFSVAAQPAFGTVAVVGGPGVNYAPSLGVTGTTTFSLGVTVSGFAYSIPVKITVFPGAVTPSLKVTIAPGGALATWNGFADALNVASTIGWSDYWTSSSDYARCNLLSPSCLYSSGSTAAGYFSYFAIAGADSVANRATGNYIQYKFGGTASLNGRPIAAYLRLSRLGLYAGSGTAVSATAYSTVAVDPLSAGVVTTDTAWRSYSLTVYSGFTSGGWSVLQQPVNAGVASVVSGQLVYQPTPGFVGSDTMTLGATLDGLVYPITVPITQTLGGPLPVTGLQVKPYPGGVNVQWQNLDTSSNTEYLVQYNDLTTPANVGICASWTPSCKASGSSAAATFSTTSKSYQFLPGSAAQNKSLTVWVTPKRAGVTGSTVSATGYVDIAPASASATFSTARDTSVSITPTFIDADTWGDSWTLSIGSQAANGVAAVTGGKLQYTPNPGYSGPDAFTFVVTDSAGGSATGTASGTVTAPPAAQVTGLAATGGTKFGVVSLNWNSSLNAAKYKLLRATSMMDANPVVVAAALTSTSFDDSPPLASTQYWYSVVAINATGDQASASDKVIGWSDTAPTAASGSFAATLNTPIVVALSWTDPDKTFGDAGQLAVVSQPSQGTAALFGSSIQYTPASDFVGTDSFTFSVTDAAGQSTVGTASGTVQALTPAQVTGVAATQGSLVGKVGVSWAASSNARWYDVFRGTSATDPNPLKVASQLSTLFFEDSAVSEGSKYWYTVKAGTIGKTAPPSVVAMGYPDTAPASVTASYAGAIDVAGTFAPVFTDPDAGDSWSLAVITQPSNGTAAVVGSSLRFTPSLHWVGTDTFTFSVRDAAGASSTGTATVTYTAPTPVAPASLVATQGTKVGKVDLAWPAGENAQWYSVYRGTSLTDPSPALLASNVATSSFSDTTAQPGVVSWYSVSSATYGQESARTSAVSGYADTPPTGASAVANVTTAVQASLVPTWTDVDPNETATLSIVSQPSHGVATASGGVLKYTSAAGYQGADSFTFRVTDKAGASVVGTATLNVVTVPGSVAGVSASQGTKYGSVQINWSTATNATSYYVFRGVSSTDPAPTLVGSAVTNAYSDTSASPGITYWYSVKGMNGSVEGPISSTVSGYADTAPSSLTGTFTAQVNTSVTFPLSWTDPDPLETGTLSVETQAAHGSVTVSGGANLKYVPDADYVGNDSFVARLTDKAGAYVSATISGQVVATVPDVPAGVVASKGTKLNEVGITWSAALYGRSYRVYVGTSATDPSPVLLGTVSTTSFADTSAQAGQVSWYFVQSVNFDKTSALSPAVSGYPDTAPSDASATFQANQDGSVQFSATWTDPDTSDIGTLAIVSQPSNGAASVVAGKLKYVPNPGYVGPDSFVFSVTDRAGASVIGTATGDVLAFTPAPVTITATKGTKVGQVVVAWGSSTYARTYKVYAGTSATDPNPALLATTASLSYADTNASPGVQTWYSVVAVNVDKQSAASATVMGYADTPPSALTVAAFQTTVDVPVTLNVSWTDPDPSDPGVLSIKSSPSSGTAVITAGKVKYTPASGFVGSDSFVIQVIDKAGAAAEFTVSGAVINVPGAVPSVVAGKGTAVGKVDLSWGAATNASSYVVSRRTTPADPAPVVFSDISGLSFSDTSAQPGVVYYYSVNGRVLGVDGPDSSQVTGYADTPPASLMASFSTEYQTAVTITPTWVDPDPADAGTLSVTRAPSHGTAAIQGLKVVYTPAAGYQGVDTFELTVTDKAGATATTTVSGTVNVTAPSTPATIAATKGTQVGAVQITWAASANSQLYEISWNSSANSAGAQLLGTSATTTYRDETPSPGEVRFYFVRGVNVDKFSAYSTGAIGYADTPPSGASAVFTTALNVVANITPVWSDPDAGDIGSLAITRQPANGIATANGARLIYTPATDFFGADNFEFSVTDRAGATTTGTATGTVVVPTPEVPSGVTATQGTLVNGVKVKWSLAASARSYTVFRSDRSDDQAPMQIATGLTALEYVDTSATAGQAWYYFVRADLMSRYSALSSAVSGYADTPPASLSATFRTVNDREVSFTPTWVDQDPGDAGVVSIVSQPSHGVAVMSSGNRITYRPAAGYIGSDSFVFAVTDRAGAVVQSTAVGLVDPGVPATPLTISASQGTAIGKVIVRWSASTGADQYLVYRATSPQASYQLVASDVVLTFEDLAANPGVTYYYRVIAKGQSGDSQPTVVVTGFADTPPTAAVLNLVTAVNQPASARPVVTDADPGDFFTVAVDSQPANGSAVVGADNATVTYQPRSGFAGSDSFGFTVRDRAGASFSSTASVAVGCDRPTIGAIVLPSGKIFAAASVPVSVRYGNAGCSATLRGALTVSSGSTILFQDAIPGMPGTTDDLLAFNVPPLSAGSYVVTIEVADTLTGLSATASTTMAVGAFLVPNYTITRNVVASIDVASVKIEPSRDCAITADQATARANGSMCFVDLQGLPTGLQFQPAKSATNLVWEGKASLAGSYPVSATFYKFDQDGTRRQVGAIADTITVSSISALTYSIPSPAPIAQHFGRAALQLKQTAGPSCPVSTDRTAVIAAVAAGQRQCYLEFYGLPVTSQVTVSGASVSYGQVGSYSVPWKVSTFDLQGGQITLFDSSTDVAVRANLLDFDLTTSGVPPLAGLTNIQVGLTSVGVDKCSLTTSASEASNLVDGRPCLVEWTEVPPGLAQVPGVNTPLLGGVFADAGSQSVGFDVSYYDAAGAKQVLLTAAKRITSTVPPMPTMTLSGAYQIDPGVYAVSVNGGTVALARFLTMPWPLDLRLHWSDGSSDEILQVDARGSQPIDAGPAPLFSRRTLEITRMLRSAPQFSASSTITVLSIPESGLSIHLDQIPASVTDTDIVTVTASVRGRLPTGTGYDATLHGSWAIQFGNIDTHGKFVPQGAPVPTDSNGVAQSTLTGAGLAVLQAQAIAVPYQADPAYRVTLKSNVAAAKVLKGTPVVGSLVPMGLQKGPAPLVSIVRLLYASVADTLAATGVQWWVSPDSGVTWSHIAAADNRIVLAYQLLQGNYLVKASFLNRNTQTRSETPPMAFTAWPTPLISLNGPTYAFVGTPVSIGIVTENVSKGMPLGAVEKSWQVDAMDLVNRRYVPRLIASGTSDTISFVDTTPGLYRLTVKARSLDSDAASPKSWRILVKNFIYAPPKSPLVAVTGPGKAEIGKAYTFTARVTTSYSLTEARQALEGEWVLPDGSTVPGLAPLVYTPTMDDLAKSNRITVVHRAWIAGYRESTETSGKFVSGLWQYQWPEWRMTTSLPTTVAPVTFGASVVPMDMSLLPYLEGLTFEWTVPPTMTVVGKPGSTFQGRINYGSENELSVKVSDARGNSSVLDILVSTTNPLPYVMDVTVTNASKWSHAPLFLYLVPKVAGGHPLDQIVQWNYKLDGAIQPVKNAGTAALSVLQPGTHDIEVEVISRMGSRATKTFQVEIPQAVAPECSLTAQRGTVARTVEVTYMCTSEYGYLTGFNWTANGRTLGDLNKPGTWLYPLPAGSDFPVTIELRATDDAGLKTTVSATAN